MANTVTSAKLDQRLRMYVYRPSRTVRTADVDPAACTLPCMTTRCVSRQFPKIITRCATLAPKAAHAGGTGLLARRGCVGSGLLAGLVDLRVGYWRCWSTLSTGSAASFSTVALSVRRIQALKMLYSLPPITPLGIPASNNLGSATLGCPPPWLTTGANKTPTTSSTSLRLLPSSYPGT